ncbi:hypothetical protein BJ165DRAFT_418627 [Panaeolus papilionaceus]|nr:hypothetical protein BJ165DRAFT_418627 [Panaeolus papilionaceus]
MSTMSHPSEIVMEDIEPRLPPEVERIIFTMTYDDIFDYKNSTALLLVAKRICEWIRPLMYRVVDQVSERATPDFAREGCPTYEQIGPFVHHLLLGRANQADSEFEQILSHFPNLKSLTFWFSVQLKHILPGLTRASLENLRMLSAALPTDISEEELCSPALLRLTHLELICFVNDIPKWDILLLYIRQSQLTHLRLYGIEEMNPHPIQAMLNVCPRLRVLIIAMVCHVDDMNGDLILRSDVVEVCEKNTNLVILEHRLCFVDGWIRGARGFYDAWTFAEQVVTARRNNYLKEGGRRWFFTSFGLHDYLNNKGREWYSEEQKNHKFYPQATS